MTVDPSQNALHEAFLAYLTKLQASGRYVKELQSVTRIRIKD